MPPSAASSAPICSPINNLRQSVQNSFSKSLRLASAPVHYDSADTFLISNSTEDESGRDDQRAKKHLLLKCQHGNEDQRSYHLRPATAGAAGLERLLHAVLKTGCDRRPMQAAQKRARQPIGAPMLCHKHCIPHILKIENRSQAHVP